MPANLGAVAHQVCNLVIETLRPTGTGRVTFG
jgi:hypothetical protein